MSKTINTQRNWKYFQLFRQSNENFKVYRADPLLSPNAVKLAQEDFNKMLTESNLTQDDVQKISYREGYRRDSKAKLKVRNRRIEKRSARQKAMIEVRDLVIDGDD